MRSLEDAEDCKAFEAAIIADYCPETAVARELQRVPVIVVHSLNA